MDEEYRYEPEVYLLGAMGLDDRHRFVDVLKSMDVESYRLKILKWLCSNSALNCTTALLEGETDLPAPVDLNVVLDTGTYPLHEAASRLNCELVDLLIRHGARTDTKSVESDLLPFQAAFEGLRFHQCLIDWTPEDSVYKLVSILCLPKMKRPLETIRLLAPSTNEINEFLIHYCMEGKIIEMAVLLIVSNKLVMAPDTLRGNDGSFLDGRMVVPSNIMEHMKESIWSLSIEEADLPADKRKRGKLIQMYRAKRVALLSALSLLKLFETAGDAIRSYLQLQPSNVQKEQVVKEVATIIKEAGILVKDTDFDLSNIDGLCDDNNSEETGLTVKELLAGKRSKDAVQVLFTNLDNVSAAGRNPKNMFRQVQVGRKKIDIHPLWSSTILHDPATNKSIRLCNNFSSNDILQTQCNGGTHGTKRRTPPSKSTNISSILKALQKAPRSYKF